jgi:hypothetical protein
VFYAHDSKGDVSFSATIDSRLVEASHGRPIEAHVGNAPFSASHLWYCRKVRLGQLHSWTLLSTEKELDTSRLVSEYFSLTK